MRFEVMSKLVFTTFLQRQGRKSSKNAAIYTVLKRKTLCFAMFFQQGALNVPQIPRFSSLFASRSQSKPTKNTGIYSVLTRQHAKKHDVFEQFFTLFQPMLLRSKNACFFLFFLPPLIRTQEGVKSGQIAKLHLNSTFCSILAAKL